MEKKDKSTSRTVFTVFGQHMGNEFHKLVSSGSVSSHSPADPSSTTRAPSIGDKLTLNKARGLCARSDPQADPYGREGQVPVGNDTYLLCHVTYLVIVIEYYMSPFTIDPMMATWVSWGVLTLAPGEILTSYAIMVINQGNSEGQLKM
ncbi:hypothetical protein GLOIN_2v1874607 [Rhizophagus irregularis DAOM 181602=DAOM 197198]|nr:hypothetical protein GLOIN_2v1874607 [Rhizophagus irregularis DAOM 181602=DAOM 197198]